MRLWFSVMVLLLGFGTLADVAAAQNADHAASDVCARYSAVPLPAEADRVTTPRLFPACASYRWYRGIGRHVDYDKARECAWTERAAQKAGLAQNEREPTAWVVGGSLILADIYANGSGVKRDVPLAMRFACEAEEGMAESAAAKLTGQSAKPEAAGRFEFCEEAMTTFSTNFCMAYQTEIEDDRRSRRYQALRERMSAGQRVAFDKLLAAENAYVDAHADEVYQGGTIRNIRTLGSENLLKDQFGVDLIHFEKKHWPTRWQEDGTGADEKEKREYQRQLRAVAAQKARAKAQDLDDGLVSPEQVAAVERVWAAYRNAWTEFAQVRYPGRAAQIRAEIDRERFEVLQSLGSDEGY